MTLISDTGPNAAAHRPTANLPAPLSRRPRPFYARGIWPGLFLAGVIAGMAFGLRQMPGLTAFSPMILAIVLGIAFHNIVGTPARAKEGVTFSVRRLLRMAIILLGLQLTVIQVIEVGGAGLAVIVSTLLATFVFTTWVGRLIGVVGSVATGIPFTLDQLARRASKD